MLPNDAHVDLTQTESQGFNNKVHVGHFFNYLFRTDKNQKWTNDKTKLDFALVYSGKAKKHVAIFLPTDLDDRIELKERFKRRVFAHISGQSVDSLLNDIVYMDICLKSTGQNIEHLADIPTEIVDIAIQIIDMKDPCKSKDIFHIVHVDQADSYYHMHTVGL